ncbi:molybdopterin guanine dinucleotide synthesis [Anianabacter salinae]|uniref:molybdopterin guanine dinucleotide synthesis n=1 Tax=Anianabacter salinae TaxID=2851023 RepID=UPI00225DEA64|nr:molybdopterin guanine dinucleotide synthesis [Anianabacter salinae]MBV0913252.1 molybdopterin guanine dinucleotide synthesis [Anianabacter salinae]
MGFDRILIVDWSASAKPSPRRPSKDAIWMAEAGADTMPPRYCRTRHDAMALVLARCDAALVAGQRLLIGWDFPMGYPAGFAEAACGEAGALALWARLAEMVRDAPDNANTRFDVAARLNRDTPGQGPFWGCPPRAVQPGLTMTKPRSDVMFPERRLVEDRVRSAQPCWKLFTTGSVGSQAILGIARLQALRQRLGPQVAVWPFEPWDNAPIVLAEVYPSLLDAAVRARVADHDPPIKDAVQVECLAGALHGIGPEVLACGLEAATGPHLAEEGWILGVGIEEALQVAAGQVVFGGGGINPALQGRTP